MRHLLLLSSLCLTLAGGRAYWVQEAQTSAPALDEPTVLELFDPTPAPRNTPAAAEAFRTPTVREPARPEPTDSDVVVTLAHLRSRHTGLSKAELAPLAELIVSEARRNRIEPALALAVIRVESGCFNYAVSSVGAMGLMQLMPSTGEELARRLGLDWRGDDSLFDPRINVRLGIAYLKQLSDRYGSTNTALAAYNWGPGRIDRRIRRGQSVPKLYATQVMKHLPPSSTRTS